MQKSQYMTLFRLQLSGHKFRKQRRIILLIAAGLFLAGLAPDAWAQPTGQATPSPALDESAIMESYKQYINDGYHARPFNPTGITVKWQEGSFTRKESREAIVLIDDVWNHQHGRSYLSTKATMTRGGSPRKGRP